MYPQRPAFLCNHVHDNLFNKKCMQGKRNLAELPWKSELQLCPGVPEGRVGVGGSVSGSWTAFRKSPVKEARDRLNVEKGKRSDLAVLRVS